MKFKSLMGVLALCLSSQGAMANTVTSQDPICTPYVNPFRLFSVTANTVVQCLFTGAGNINGNTNGNEPGNAVDIAMFNAGWTLVDAEDLFGLTSGQVANNSAFSIDANLYNTYGSVAIGFKSGVGQLDPDFAIFEFANGTLGGTFTISPFTGGGSGFSHAVIWAKGPSVCIPTPENGFCGQQQIPEPNALALVALGLVAAGAAGRRWRVR